MGALDGHGRNLACLGQGAIAVPIVEHVQSGQKTAMPDHTAPISAGELAAVIGVDADRAGHLLAAAWELVQRYAPDAPTALHREAVVRCAGWLAEQPSAAVRSQDTGDISTSYAASNMSALRHSGAMALLTSWKIRRAGAI